MHQARFNQVDEPFSAQDRGAPRIYDPELAEETRQQIEQAVQNMGYMGARVELLNIRRMTG